MWLDISIAISCAVAGLGCGWVMHAIGFVGDSDLNALVTLNDSNKVTDERLEKVAKGRISEVAGRLHDYATTMAMDVDAHQSRVQAVNNSLQNQVEDGGNEAIYRAVDELIAANDSMQEKLRVAQERIQEQTAQLESAEKMAHTDGLTRIANRRAFDDHLDKQFDLGHKEAGTLAILDVDHFKKFNDTYGHRAGDEVLRAVASILNARLNPYGIAARFGGEEFAIVMNGIAVEKAAEIVNHARAAVGERDVHFGDKRLRVTMSAGLAELLPSESKENWLQRADDGLYHSKENGRDCAHWMDGKTPRRVGGAVESDSQTQTSEKQSPELQTPDAKQAEESSSDDANASAAAAKGKPPAIADAETDAGSPEGIEKATASAPAGEVAKPTDRSDKADEDGGASDSKVEAGTDSTESNVNQGGGESKDSPEFDADKTQATENVDSKALDGPGDSETSDKTDSEKVDSDKADKSDAATSNPGQETVRSEQEDDLINSKTSSEKDDGTEPDDNKEAEATDSKSDEDAIRSENKSAQAEKQEIARSQRAKPDGSGPRAFNYLPDADALEEAMKDLHERSQSANIPLHVMAIRFDRDAGKSTTRELLQIVRATLRSVDRIGCDDECTLLVCMPNLDEHAAMERAQQICHSSETLSEDETDGEAPCNVCIGLADAANDPNFAQVVSRVKFAADQARADGSVIQFAE